MKVSVVIPTYKRPVSLKRCLEALISQDFAESEFEIIVVTDGIDETTGRMLEESFIFDFFSNLHCYALPMKSGPAAARNAGWKIATGDLILFTDDDCIPDVAWVKNYYNAYEFYGEKFIAFSGRIKVPVSPAPTDFEINTSHLETAQFVTANCACSRTALELVGGFDEEFTMAWREDSDLEFKLLECEIPILKIEEALVIHPVRKAPWGISLKEQKKSMFDALLFKRHPGLYKERISSSSFWVYYFIILSFVYFLTALSFDQDFLAITGLLIWLFLMGMFISKRLSRTSHSLTHVTEMVATSLLIPFYSVFWNLYGAVKYKVVHL
jgi:glycosyltransferase involved in cell wall biosynthesis